MSPRGPVGEGLGLVLAFPQGCSGHLSELAPRGHQMTLWDPLEPPKVSTEGQWVASSQGPKVPLEQLPWGHCLWPSVSLVGGLAWELQRGLLEAQCGN